MNATTLAKAEFLLDSASYFSDKKPLYLEIKSQISDLTFVDLSEIRICGSAYWGKRFVDQTPFEPGTSDLDVALVSPSAFCRCMSEVREISKNFKDQTVFPHNMKDISTYEIFRDYAFGKGLIRIEHLPNTKTKDNLRTASDKISRNFLNHFEKISFAIYDSALSFAVKQTNAAKKFRT